jgi:hypothetical protein
MSAVFHLPVLTIAKLLRHLDGAPDIRLQRVWTLLTQKRTVRAEAIQQQRTCVCLLVEQNQVRRCVAVSMVFPRANQRMALISLVEIAVCGENFNHDRLILASRICPLVNKLHLWIRKWHF